MTPSALVATVAFVARLCAAAETKDGEFPTFKIYVTVTGRVLQRNTQLARAHLVGPTHSFLPMSTHSHLERVSQCSCSSAAPRRVVLCKRCMARPCVIMTHPSAKRSGAERDIVLSHAGARAEAGGAVRRVRRRKGPRVRAVLAGLYIHLLRVSVFIAFSVGMPAVHSVEFARAFTTLCMHAHGRTNCFSHALA